MRHAALDVADGVLADAGALGQLLLGEARRPTMAPQQAAKRLALCSFHLAPPPLMYRPGLTPLFHGASMRHQRSFGKRTFGAMFRIMFRVFGGVRGLGLAYLQQRGG